jgi:hypothetical protein
MGCWPSGGRCGRPPARLWADTKSASLLCLSRPSCEFVVGLLVGLPLGSKLASLYCVGLADTCLANAFTHACGVTIIVGDPIPLAAIVMAGNCGGRLGSCHGKFVGSSRDDAIAAVHATVRHRCLCCTCIAARIITGIYSVPTQSRHAGVHGVVALILYMPVALLPTWHHITVTWFWWSVRCSACVFSGIALRIALSVQRLSPHQSCS